MQNPVRAVCDASEAGYTGGGVCNPFFGVSKGENQAYLIMNKLSIIRCYLIEVLGIDEDAAEQDACAIEHVVSNETLCSMCRQTGKDICSEDCYLKIDSELRKT